MPGAGPGLFLVNGPAGAQVPIAEEPPLGSGHFDPPGDSDVAKPLWPACMHAGADHTTGGAAGVGGHDADRSLPEGEDLNVGDAVVGHVQVGGGSIGARGITPNT